MMPNSNLSYELLIYSVHMMNPMKVMDMLLRQFQEYSEAARTRETTSGGGGHRRGLRPQAGTETRGGD